VFLEPHNLNGVFLYGSETAGILKEISFKYKPRNRLLAPTFC